MAGKLRVQELATRANVSVATVSRILNGSARVSQELQDRVRKAGDVPNPLWQFDGTVDLLTG